MKKNKPTKRTVVLNVLTVFFAAVFVFSAVNLLLVMAEYRKSEKQYAEMQNDFVVTTTTVPTTAPDPEEPPEPTKPVAPIAIDFDGLLKRNSDVVGWLYCEDSVINYPVVQANDNDEYLDKDLNGKYLRSGTLFVDCHNQKQPQQDRNYIIYGHSMRNGSMFGMLAHYKKQSYYDEHPVMYFLTPEGDYRIELFAGRVIKTTDPIYSVSDDSEEFFSHLQTMQEKSTFDSDVTITKEDKIVTLSTCSYEFDQARYVVLGKLIPIE